MLGSFWAACSGYLHIKVVKTVPKAGIRNFMSFPQLLSMEEVSRIELTSISKSGFICEEKAMKVAYSWKAYPT